MSLSIALRPFHLRLSAPVSTARGPIAIRAGMLVRASDGEGLHGFGEAAPLPAFGTEDLATASSALQAAAERLRGAQACDEIASVETMLARAALPPQALSARCALEQALLDLAARRRGCPLWRFLAGLAPRRDLPRPSVELCALLVEKEPSVLAAEAKAAREEGYAAVKLKIGMEPLACDLARIEAVRRSTGEDLAIRLDANGAFSLGQALDALPLFAAFAPLLCEQPVAPGQADAWGALAGRCPLAADESAARRDEIDRLFSSFALIAVVLKPSALGGLLPALRLGLRGRASGVEPIASTGMDGAVGRAGAAHLAAALGSRLPAGLATARFFAEDLGADPALPRDGRIELGEAPGLGADW